ncbi:hypothetical protein B0H11DRAFT_2024572 [Mycena galericulata]|nr:hypothetical protein B0H11DRAFT_2024572 [Mycena galericulata]
MAAGQSVFSITPLDDCIVPTRPLSVPAVRPTKDTLVNFWRRVAELTTRYHDFNNNWVGGSEIRKWNEETPSQACSKCLNSKKKRACIIDEDQPSCRTCRESKVRCDRKPRFVYEMTKDEFFSKYEDFTAVFNNGRSNGLRKYVRTSRDSPKRLACGMYGPTFD